jgi:2-oxoglutarate ferredoxin oxidoreductase subunit gamma
MSNDRYELCFVGSGGQDVILASTIFAEAALLSGKKTIQFQQSLDQYAGQVRPGGIILAGSGLTPLKVNVRYVNLRILRIARKEVKKTMTANTVATGAINEILHIFSDEVLEEAVRRHIPAGTEDVNLRALKAGKQLGIKAVA